VHRILDFGRSQLVLSLILGTAAGAAIGFIAFYVMRLTGVLLFVVLGALLGLAAAAALELSTYGSVTKRVR
jgi:hypothetical protein